MFGQPIKSVMERRKLLLLPPHTSVAKAARLMADKETGAALVVDGERLVGIFTERDALFRVIARGLDPKDTPLAAVMTPDPKTIAPDKSFGHAMLVMHENRFHHLPVVQDGKPIGIVSARDALDPDLEEFVSEERRRRHIRETL